MKIVLNNRQYRVTLPKELAISKGWTKGHVLMFIEDKEGNIYLKEIRKDMQKRLE